MLRACPLGLPRYDEAVHRDIDRIFPKRAVVFIARVPNNLLSPPL